MDKAGKDGRSPVLPIVLKGSADMLMVGLLYCGFFCLVMLLFGLMMGSWSVCGLSALFLVIYGTIL